MKYNILINQKAIIDNGWHDIKANHIAVLEVIRSFISSLSCQRMEDENGLWFWINTKLIIDQIPMFEIKERRCKDLIKDLVKVGLIEINPNNQKLGRSFLRLGKSIKSYDFASNGGSVQNIATPMQNIADPLCNKLQTPMQNIADNNTINNNNINNTKEECEIKNSTQPEKELLNLFDTNEKGKEKKVSPKKEKISKEIIFPIVKELIKHFPSHVLKRLTDPQKKKWGETIEQLIRLDSYTKEEITQAVEFARNDSFWKNNFLSLNKLRKTDKNGTKYISIFLNAGSNYVDDDSIGSNNYKPAPENPNTKPL